MPPPSFTLTEPKKSEGPSFVLGEPNIPDRPVIQIERTPLEEDKDAGRIFDIAADLDVATRYIEDNYQYFAPSATQRMQLARVKAETLAAKIKMEIPTPIDVFEPYYLVPTPDGTPEERLEWEMRRIWRTPLDSEQKSVLIEERQKLYYREVAARITDTAQSTHIRQSMAEEKTQQAGRRIERYSRSWTRGVGRVAGSAMQLAGDISGSKKLKENASDWYMAISQSPDLASFNEAWFDWVMNTTLETAPFMLAAAAPALITGGATVPTAIGSFVTSYAVESNSMYQEAKIRGESERNARLRSIVGGLINAGIEIAGGGGAAKFYKARAVTKAMTKLQRAKTVTRASVINALREGLMEEMPQEGVSIIVGGDVPRNADGSIDWGGTADRLMQAAAAGTLLGFGASAGINISRDITLHKKTMKALDKSVAKINELADEKINALENIDAPWAEDAVRAASDLRKIQLDQVERLRNGLDADIETGQVRISDIKITTDTAATESETARVKDARDAITEARNHIGALREGVLQTDIESIDAQLAERSGIIADNMKILEDIQNEKITSAKDILAQAQTQIAESAQTAEVIADQSRIIAAAQADLDELAKPISVIQEAHSQADFGAIDAQIADRRARIQAASRQIESAKIKLDVAFSQTRMRGDNADAIELAHEFLDDTQDVLKAAADITHTFVGKAQKEPAEYEGKPVILDQQAGGGALAKPDTGKQVEDGIAEVKNQISQSIGAARAGFESFDPAARSAQKKARKTGRDWYVVQLANTTPLQRTRLKAEIEAALSVKSARAEKARINKQEGWIEIDSIPPTGHFTIVRPDGGVEFIKQASLTADEAFDFAEKIKGPKLTDKAEAIRRKFTEKIDNAVTLKKELKSFLNRSLPPSAEKAQALGILSKISAKSSDKTNVKNFSAALVYVDFATEKLRKQQAIADYKKTLKGLKKKFGTRKTMLGEMRPEFAEKASAIIDGIDLAKLSSSKRDDYRGLQHKVQGLAKLLADESLIETDPDLTDDTVLELLSIPEDRIKQLSRLGKTPLADMRAADIETINDELARIVGMNNLKNKLIGKKDIEQLAAALSAAQDEMIPTRRVRKGKGPASAGPTGQFLHHAAATIPTSLQETSGSLDNVTSKYLLWDVLDGLGKRYGMEQEIKQYVHKRLNEAQVDFATVKKWRNTKHSYRINGKDVVLNEEQLLSVLMDMRNPDNRAAAQNGYKWFTKTATGKELPHKTGRLTFEQIAILLEPMTAKHKAAADIANEVLDSKTKPELTRTSLRLFGHDMFRVIKYWAMNRVRPLSLPAAKESIAPLSERGFTKPRVGGSQPLYLMPFFSKLHNSIEESAAYAHMMVPIFNAKSIMATKAWQNAMEDAGRADEMHQIIGKFKALEQSVSSRDALELWSGKAFRGYGRSRLGLNLGSIAAQVTSEPLLFAADPVQWAKHTAWQPTRSLQKEIDAHNGILWKRHSAGRFTKDIGDIRATGTIDEFFFDKKTLLNKPMQLQAWTDTMVVQKAWKMAKGYVETNRPEIAKGTDNYWDAVNRRVNELMLTQPNWEPFLRSAILTSPAAATRALFAFHSPIEAMYNMHLRAMADVKNNVPGASQNLIATTASIGAALVAYRTVKELYYGGLKELPKLAGRGKDDDDDKKAFAKMPEQLVYDVLNLSPAGKLIVPITEKVVSRVLERRRPRGVLERNPIAQSVKMLEMITTNIAAMADKKVQGDPNWDELMPMTVQLAAEFGSIFPGAPVSAPIRVLKPWFESDPDPVAEFRKSHSAFEIKRRAGEHIEETKKRVEEAKKFSEKLRKNRGPKK